MAIQLVEVNLSEELARRSERKASRVHMPWSVGTLLVVTVLLLTGFHMMVYFREQSYNRAQAEFKELGEPSEEAEQLQELLLELQGRVALLQTWRVAKVTTAARWRALSQLLPDTAHLTRIELSHTGPAGDVPRLALTGRAQGEQGESVVLGFMDRLKSEPVFTNAFSKVVLSSIQTENDEKVFTIELTR
jgi:hypothetical protein